MSQCLCSWMFHLNWRQASKKYSKVYILKFSPVFALLMPPFPLSLTPLHLSTHRPQVKHGCVLDNSPKVPYAQHFLKFIFPDLQQQAADRHLQRCSREICHHQMPPWRLSLTGWYLSQQDSLYQSVCQALYTVLLPEWVARVPLRLLQRTFSFSAA